MPDIRTYDVQTDGTLTNFAIDWKAPGLIAPVVLDIVPMADRGAKYPIYEAESFRLINDSRGENDVAQEVDFPMSKDSYWCNDHALRRFVADQLVRAASNPAYARTVAMSTRVKQLKRLIQRNWEVEVATLFTTAGNYLSTLYEDLDAVAGRNFDDAANGLAILLDYMDRVELACGMMPEEMVIAADVWQLLQLDSNFIATLSTGVQLKLETLADMVGVNKIHIARGSYNSAAKGAGDQTMARLWGSNFICALIKGGGNTVDEPKTACTFVWNAFPGSSQGETVQRYRDPARGGGGEFVEYSHYRDVKATGVNSSGKIISGFLLANVYIAL